MKGKHAMQTDAAVAAPALYCSSVKQTHNKSITSSLSERIQ